MFIKLTPKSREQEKHACVWLNVNNITTIESHNGDTFVDMVGGGCTRVVESIEEVMKMIKRGNAVATY